jgi:hypothetical protein
VAVVGSAEVVIRAIGDKLEGDIQRALNNAAAKARPAGRKAGENYAEGLGDGIEANSGSFTSVIEDRISGAMDKGGERGGKSVADHVKNSVDGVGDGGGAAVGDRIGKSIGNNVARGMQRSGMRRGVASVLLKLGLLIPVVSILIGGISTLVGGLFAMSSTMTLAVSSSVALGGALVAIGAAAVAGMVGFKGVGKAIQEGMKPDNAKKFAEELKKIAPAARPFVKDFVKLKDEFKAIRNSAAEGLFNGLGNALKRITPILPRMTDEFNVLGQAAGDAVESIVRKFTAGDFRRNMGEIVASVPIVMDDLSKAFGNVGQTFASVFAAAAPLTERFAESIRKSTKGLRDQAQAGKESGKLQSFFNRAGDAAAQMGRIIKNVVVGLFDIGKVGGKTGQRLFDALEKASEGLANYTDSAKNVKGLETAFDGIGTNMIKIGGLAKDLGKAFLRMGASKGIGETADAIRKIVPDIERAMTAGINLGPKIAEIVGELAKMFAVFQESGALSAVLDIFISLAKVMNMLLQIPGAKIAIQIMAIVTALRLLGKGAGFIGRGIGTNFAAMDAAVGRTRRTFVSMQAPATALENRMASMRRSFLTSNTGMLLFRKSSAQLIATQQSVSRAMGGVTGSVNRLGVNVHGASSSFDAAGRAANNAGGRFQSVGQRMGSAFKGMRLGAGGAGTALIGLGAAAGASSGAMNKFSGTLTGAAVGSMFGPLGAGIGAAAGGLVDLGRHFLGTSDKAKKSAEAIKAYTANIKQMGTGVRDSAGFADDFAFLDQIEKKMAYWQNQRKNKILVGGDTSDIDAKLKALETQWEKTKSHIENNPPSLSARADFADTRLQVEDLVKGIKTRMNELGRTKFKFNMDSGPFRRESIELGRALEALKAGALDTGDFAGMRNALVGMKDLFGLNRQEAKLLANSLVGLDNPLEGISKPRKIKFTPEMAELFRDLGVGEEAIARIQNAGKKPVKIAATVDVRDGGAESTISALTAKLKTLEPTQMITLETDSGPVTRSVADVTAAIQAWRKQPADLTLGADGKPALMDADAAMDGIIDILGKTDPTVEVGAEKKPGTDSIFNSIAAAVLGVDQEVFAKLGAQKLPGFDGIISGVLSQTGKIQATDVRALVGAKQGDMGAVGKVLQQAGIIDKTQAKALVGAKKGDMSAIANVLREAGLITKKEYKALVGAKKGDTKDIGALKNDIGNLTGKTHEAKVGVKKATGGGFFGTVTDILKSVAPSKTQTVSVGVKADTGKAKGDISALGRNMAVNIPTRADTGKAQGAINKISRKNPVTIASKLGGQAQAALNKVSRKGAVNVKTKADTAAQNTINKINRKGMVSVKTKADSAAQNAVNKISRKGSVSVPVKITGDPQGKINAIKGKTVSVYVKLTGPGASEYAGGGLVRGPGAGFSDMVPAWLSNGEFVVRASQVKKNLALLKAINAGSGLGAVNELQPAPTPVFDFSPSTSTSSASGPMHMTVSGVLDLGNSQAYITGVAQRQNASDTAYKNSLVRSGH